MQLCIPTDINILCISSYHLTVHHTPAATFVAVITLSSQI